MPALPDLCRRLGNDLYKLSFPTYRSLYSVFKTWSDRTERRLLKSVLSPGAIAVDAGANIGVYSQFLARCVGSTGAVHSFEPSPDNFIRLKEGLKTFANVRLNQLLVADKTGTSTLYVSDELNVDHRAYPPEGKGRRTLTIGATALDDYFEVGARVDLIKMDIQGYELHALRGAERMLADNPEIKILLEFWPFGLKQAGMSAEGLVSFLRERGFHLFNPTKTGLVVWESQSEYSLAPDGYLNLFAQKSAEGADFAVK